MAPSTSMQPTIFLIMELRTFSKRPGVYLTIAHESVILFCFIGPANHPVGSISSAEYLNLCHLINPVKCFVKYFDNLVHKRLGNCTGPSKLLPRTPIRTFMLHYPDISSLL